MDEINFSPGYRCRGEKNFVSGAILVKPPNKFSRFLLQPLLE